VTRREFVYTFEFIFARPHNSLIMIRKTFNLYHPFAQLLMISPDAMERIASIRKFVLKLSASNAHT
jgi:hypothetical protein